MRVTGSGAGCADHWPLCNGELVPRSPSTKTVIEATHRLTSSLAGLLSLVVLVRAYRVFGPRSPVRRAALIGFVLMLVEGAIGALLVKKGLVAQDASEARAFVVGLHLVNTFLLLAAQMATWHFARGGAALQLRAHRARALLLGAMLLLLLLLGATGAITALGDTLFPAASLGEGISQDLSAQAHFLVRLRVWHPLLAVASGALVVYLAQHLRAALGVPEVSRWALGLSLLYVLQLGVGSLNLFLLAPGPIQILHLLLADLTWLGLVGLSLVALGVPQAEPQPSLASAAS